ncbi:MAG: stage II sporulation protein M [Pseudomonadota bacterium]
MSFSEIPRTGPKTGRKPEPERGAAPRPKGTTGTTGPAGEPRPTAEAAILRSARFRSEREEDWQRLDALVARVERRGPRSLDFGEARTMATLYRQAATSLSVARAISLDRALLSYLEALVTRAYLAVYAPQEGLGGALWRFLASSASQAMRGLWPFMLAGLATMMLGGLTGWLLFLENEAWYDVLVPRGPDDVRGPEATREELLSVIYDGGGSTLDELSAFAAFLFSNNARIAIFAFALGAFACLPTFILIFYQGLFIGCFVALHVDRGVGLDLFGWLSIHGVTELGAIVVAAGAGYAVGFGVLFPGREHRRTAMARMARPAVKAAIVAALMLFAAAVLEGFGRQLIQDTTTRIVIGWGIGGLWLLWWLAAGRRA